MIWSNATGKGSRALRARVSAPGYILVPWYQSPCPGTLAIRIDQLAQSVVGFELRMSEGQGAGGGRLIGGGFVGRTVRVRKYRSTQSHVQLANATAGRARRAFSSTVRLVNMTGWIRKEGVAA